MIDLIELVEYFNLDSDPFGKCADDEVFRGKKYMACVNVLAQLLRRGEMCALVGPAGSGKTTLLNDLVGRCNEQGVIVARVGHPGRREVNASCVYTAIAAALPEHGVKFSMLRQLKILELAELLGDQLAGRRVAIIVDEAHRLRNEFLRGMKEFNEIAYGVRSGLLGVLFAGLPEFKTNARRYVPDIYARLVVGRRIIEAAEVMRGEIREYVKHRARVAGNARLFDESGLNAISVVAGTPLRANAACWNSMEQAYMDSSKVVRAQHVAACYDMKEKKMALGPGCTLEKISEASGLHLSTCGSAINGSGSAAITETVDDVLNQALAAGGIDRIGEKARKAG